MNMETEAKKGEEFRDDDRTATRLPAAVIKELAKQDDAKAWVSVVTLLLVLAVCFGVSLAVWSPWVVIPSVLIIASRQQACFVLAHDAAHYRLFKSRVLNDLVGCALAAPVGISMRTYRVVHRLHHNHLYTPQDPDIPLHGGYPRGRSYLLKKLLIDLTGRTAPKTIAYFLGAPAINDENPNSNRPLHDTTPALRQAARRDRWLVIGFHIGAPLMAAFSGHLMAYLILWILPLCTILQALLRFRAICEHGAVKDQNSPLLAARTNLGPKWLRWFLFPYHVNYHVEHHLYPAIPHYNLPACHQEMLHHGILEGAEVRQVFETAGLISANPASVN